MNDVAPGWYPDPHKGSRLRYWDGTTWTQHVNGGGPRMGLWLGIGIPAVLIVGALTVAAVVAGQRATDPDPAATDSAPAATPSETAAQEPRPSLSPRQTLSYQWVVTPGDTIAYVAGLSWDDATDSAHVEAKKLHLAEGEVREVSGGWWISDLAFNDGTLVTIVTSSTGKPVTDIKAELARRVKDLRAAGLKDFTTLRRDEYVTYTGYDAARWDYSATDGGAPVYASCIAVTDGKVVVFVETLSASDLWTFAAETQTVTSELEIHHAPTR